MPWEGIMNINWLPMTLHAQQVMIDPKDAPEGFYPVPKDSVYNRENISHMYSNICRACDWRPVCSGSVCHCMPDKRADGISVVFKFKEINSKNVMGGRYERMCYHRRNGLSVP
jgi:hypothetical protein